MISVNKATILGNLTRDPELRYTPNGQAVCNFGVATNRKYKNTSTGELVEDTQFHDVVAWGKLAEIINQIFKKGNKIYLEGRLQTRQWEAPDGSKRYRTEIVMDTFVPLTPRAGGVAGGVGGNGAEPGKTIQAEKPASVKADSPDKPTSQPINKSTKGEPKTEKTSEENEEFNLDDIPF